MHFPFFVARTKGFLPNLKADKMISSARTIPCPFPILLHTRNLYQRSRKLASVFSLNQNKRFRSAGVWRMTQESEISNNMIKSGVGGVVLPATDHYIEDAIEAIKAGKVIAVPTDTIYGFACDACSVQAVNQIYEIKRRNLTSPLAICVADVSDIPRFAVVDCLPHGLLESLLPGSMTVVLRRGDTSILERSLNPGLDSIGIRVPNCDFIRSIARGSESALALTSANLSREPSSVSTKDFEHLWQSCAYVFDGGLLPAGRAGSTVVDLTMLGKYKILRPGSALKETTAVLHGFSIEEAS